MSKVVDLFKNKWVTVVEKTLDNGSKYVYSKADWCSSEGVAILPYRARAINEDWGYYKPEFLGRFEICPAHSDDIELCSITGGMDKEGESPAFTAKRELIEEGGYDVPVENFVYLGTVRPSKASDTTTHLFAVDLDKGANEVEATGDGTLGEEGAYCDWVSLEEATDCKDPLVHTILMRAIKEGLI